MKKYILLFGLCGALLGCNDAGNGKKSNAAANDSTHAPDGASNSSAISTNPNATKTADTTK